MVFLSFGVVLVAATSACSTFAQLDEADGCSGPGCHGDGGFDVTADPAVARDVLDAAEVPELVETDLPAACPELVLDPRVSVDVTEGQRGFVNLPITVDDSELWTASLAATPAPPRWLEAPRVRTDNVQIPLVGTGVPYNAWGHGPILINLEFSTADGACRKSVEVSLSVINALRTPLEYNALPRSDAAVWDEAHERFFLLDADSAQVNVLSVVDDNPSLEVPIVVEGAGPIAPTVALGEDTLFVIRDRTLMRIGLNGRADGPDVHLGVSNDDALPTMAWAGGWLLVGRGYHGGPTVALQDGADAFITPDRAWDDAYDLTTDGHRLAFWLAGSTIRVWSTIPGQWDTASACEHPDTGLLGIGLWADQLAWFEFGSGGWQLTGATIGQCTTTDPIAISDSAPPMAALSHGRALLLYGGRVDWVWLALYDLATGEPEGDPFRTPTRGDTNRTLVMGGLRYAVVVMTGIYNSPILIQL